MALNVSGTLINEFIITGFDGLEKPIVVGIVILIAFILVILANIANICYILMDKRLHQPMYLFICNLAVVDMLYCTSSCPTMIGVLLVGYNRIAYGQCMVQMYAFGLGFVMELLTITVMSFDRLIAIVDPLRYPSVLTNFRSVMLTFLMWVVGSASMAIVPGTIISLSFCSSKLKNCFCDYASVVSTSCVNPTPYFTLMSSFTFVMLFGTFTFICMSYIKIVIVVVKMTSKGSKKKAFYTCISHLIVIVCYYGPTFVLIVLTRIGVVLSLKEQHGLRIGTIIGPALVNPFIYCLRTKEIRNKMFRCVSKMEPTKQK